MPRIEQRIDLIDRLQRESWFKVTIQGDIVTIDTKGIRIEDKVTPWVVTVDAKGLGNYWRFNTSCKHMILTYKENCKGTKQHKDLGRGDMAPNSWRSQLVTTKKNTKIKVQGSNSRIY